MIDKTIKIASNTRVGADSIAAIIGKSRQRVVQLTQEGVFSKDDAGKYLLVDNVRRWMAYNSTEKTGPDYDDERTLHEKVKRETSEIALAKIRGEVHASKDIMMMVGGMVTVFKRRMLSIPHKMAVTLAEKTADDINELLSCEITAALTELSQFDASRLAEYNGDDPEDS